MAKSKQRKSKATRKAKGPKQRAKGVNRQLAGRNPPEVPLLPTVKRAVLITSELLAHFGAGYGVQAAADGVAPGPQPQPTPPFTPPVFRPLQIFETAAVLQKFQVLLLASCHKNRGQILWTSGPDRGTFCKMAFLHGMYARQLVQASGGTVVTDQILKESFDMVHLFCPPRVGGGGPTCEFEL